MSHKTIAKKNFQEMSSDEYNKTIKKENLRIVKKYICKHALLCHV